MDRVPFECQCLSLLLHGELMVGLDGLERSHSGKEGLPASGVSCEIVGLDGCDDHQAVRVHGDLIDLHRGPVLRCSQEDALGVLGIVANDAVLQVLVVDSEHEVVLLLGHVPVGSGRDEISGLLQVHPLRERIEDLRCRGRACTVVDDEDYILPACEELIHGSVAYGVVDRFSDYLVRIAAFDILRVVCTHIVLVWDVHFLNPVLPVLHI